MMMTKTKTSPARAARKSASRKARKSTTAPTLSAALDLLNHGATLEELNVDLVALNDHANSNPELPLAGNLRTNLHRAASLSVSPSEDAN